MYLLFWFCIWVCCVCYIDIQNVFVLLQKRSAIKRGKYKYCKIVLSYSFDFLGTTRFYSSLCLPIILILIIIYKFSNIPWWPQFSSKMKIKIVILQLYLHLIILEYMFLLKHNNVSIICMDGIQCVCIYTTIFQKQNWRYKVDKYHKIILLLKMYRI